MGFATARHERVDTARHDTFPLDEVYQSLAYHTLHTYFRERWCAGALEEREQLVRLVQPAGSAFAVGCGSAACRARLLVHIFYQGIRTEELGLNPVSSNRLVGIRYFCSHVFFASWASSSNLNAMADPPAPAVSARLSGPSAVLRLPEQKAAVLERLLGAAQRLDVMIAQVGAVALQLVRPQEPNPFTPTDRGAETYEPEDLKAMTKAFDVALHDYAMEHFSKNSFRAVAWWLSGLPDWSVAQPMLLPPVTDQLKAR